MRLGPEQVAHLRSSIEFALAEVYGGQLPDGVEDKSIAELIAFLPTKELRAKMLLTLPRDETERLSWAWWFWGRPKQFAPAGDWGTWILRAGRGFGKTRSGCGWVHERAMEYEGRWIALIAKNPADARDYMIEGPGGLLRTVHPEERPSYEPSKRRLTWPNGSWATVYSSEEPDQLRGYSGDTAWLDEFAKYDNAKECWDNLQFGMREASTDRPRRLITTTPRPLPVLIELEKAPSSIVVIGSSYENQSNLDPTWYEETLAPYVGTRFGRQEISAEILTDIPGAMWTRAILDANRITDDERPDMQRVVVAIDPSGANGDDEKADSIGIVVAGKGVDGRGYVLADYTCSLSPEGWGRRAVEAYRRHSADRIIAERNFGGAMVEHVIRVADRAIPYKEVTASRGKVVRAEPISALYEQGRVKHVGPLPELEDQLCAFTHTGYIGEGSPDRADALVWALTELMLAPVTTVSVQGFRL